MDKYVLIVEKQTEKLIKEQSVQNPSKFLLNGPFTEFDIENRNKRFYTAPNFIPVMNALLEKKKLLGVLYGEFDHPDVFDIAGKNTSHAIESLVHNENSNRVDGSIALLSTHWGKEARAIINDGYPLFVSSRAAGVTDGSGNVALKELFTYDIVLDPGFASARVSVNESFGLKSTDNVQYRIYEMKDEHINNLFLDNKNDNKTKMDLTEMKQLFADEAAKIEFQILQKLGEGKSNPAEVKILMQKYDNIKEEMSSVNEYLKFLQTKVVYLVKENTALSTDNKKLVIEMNENTAYANHIASQVKNLNKYAKGIETRLSVDEKFMEHVAEHAKANILFSTDIATDVKNNAAFLEYVAKEGEITQKFVENTASETEIAQKMLEYVATEVKDTQGLLEHVATEANKDEIWLNYIAEKVDGIVGYNIKAINKIKASIPLKEGIADEDDIHNLEPITDHLGLEEEQDAVNNNITNDTTVEPETPAQPEVPVQPETPAQPEVQVQPETIVQPEVPVQPETIVQPAEVVEVQPVIAVDATSVPAALDITNTSDTADIQAEPNIKTSLMSALVKIIGTDDTGVVINATDDKITIQKSGSEDTQDLNHGEYEVLNPEENVTEKVNHVLSEIKKAKVLANKKPHFYSFLSEQQIAEFKLLDSTHRDAIVLELYSSEYYNAQDVLNVIGRVITEKRMSYEDRIVGNVPALLKETWNGLDQTKKLSIIAESKYFNLVTTSDIANFWSTRPFAKAVFGPEAVMIKESVQSIDGDVLTDNYVNAFLKTFDNLKTK